MTTSDYLTQLQNDKNTLVQNLETMGITGLTGDETFTALVPQVLNIPSGGGSLTINSLSDYITAKEDLFQKFDDFLNSKVSSYPAYTNEGLTLYGPHNCKHYIIHKRSSGKYRIIWSDYECACVWMNTTVGFFGFTVPYVQLSGSTLSTHSPILNVPDIKVALTPTGTTSTYNWTTQYYSNEFNTIADLINEITTKNGNITYTAYNGGVSYGAVLDSPYLITYSNMPVIDRRNDGFEVIESQILSHNETILDRNA